MIKTTRWTPDTCDCSIEYEWDDSLPIEERVHTFKRFVHKGSECDDHAPVDDDDLFQKITDENKRKNTALNHILENFPNLVDVTTDEFGNEVKTLKKGLRFKYAFDKDRKMTAELEGASPVQKLALRTALRNRINDARFDFKA